MQIATPTAANCGEIYRHGSDTVCSEPCFNAFLRSM